MSKIKAAVILFKSHISRSIFESGSMKPGKMPPVNVGPPYFVIHDEGWVLICVALFVAAGLLLKVFG